MLWYWFCESTAEFSILGYRDFGDHGFLGQKENTKFTQKGFWVDAIPSGPEFPTCGEEKEVQ